MPKLKAEVVTQTTVELSTKLKQLLKTKLNEFRLKTAEAKAIAEDLAKRKNEMETLFADANEYDALETGVTVTTPFGNVPMKIVKGKTAPKLNMKKLHAMLAKYEVPLKALEKCYDGPKDKKPYLGIWLTEDKTDEGDTNE